MRTTPASLASGDVPEGHGNPVRLLDANRNYSPVLLTETIMHDIRLEAYSEGRAEHSGQPSTDLGCSLSVRECIPFATPLLHDLPLRTASVSKPDEALSLPWIRRLPGEKRIQFVHGQIFVVQHYLGCTLARAHIYRTWQFYADHSPEH